MYVQHLWRYCTDDDDEEEVEVPVLEAARDQVTQEPSTLSSQFLPWGMVPCSERNIWEYRKCQTLIPSRCWLVPLEKERGTCTPSSLCVCTTYCTPWSEINKTSLPIHNITPMFIWSYVYVFLLIFCHMDLIKFNLFGVDGKTMWTFSNFQWITHIVHSIKEKGTDSSMTVTLEHILSFFHHSVITST